MCAVVRSLAHGVQIAGCEVGVFAGIDRYTEQERSQWAELNVTVRARRGPPAFNYMPGLVTQLQDARLDLLHTHGLWTYPSLAAVKWAQRTGKPYVISPHGMLDAWAVGNSHWKKLLAGWLYESAHLRQAACIHALCQAEAMAIRAYGLSNPICVIPNGVELPQSQPVASPRWQGNLPANAKVLLYLGRIHPKKGLTNLLHAWHQNRIRESSSDDWYLVIAGWDQDGHEAELKSIASQLGIIDKVLFVGPQFGLDKSACYHRADAFTLPSLSEGLPMVVLEAWAYQLPVIMTPQCNLPEGFASSAALSIEANADSIGLGLRTLCAMTEENRRKMGSRGRKLVETDFQWSRIADQMNAVYKWVGGKGERPECVLAQ